jgi:hypothetical protein
VRVASRVKHEPVVREWWVANYSALLSSRTLSLNV